MWPSAVPGGGERNQPAAAWPSAVPGGRGRNQPAAAWPSAVPGGGKRHQPAAPSVVSGGGARNQPVGASLFAVPSGGERNQPAAAWPSAVSCGGARNQPAAVLPFAVPGGGARNEPAAAQPYALPEGGGRNQSSLPSPSTVSGGGNQPAVRLSSAIPQGGLRMQPVLGRGACSKPTVAQLPTFPGGGPSHQPAIVQPAAVLGWGASNQPAFVRRPAVVGGGPRNKLAPVRPPAVPEGGARNQPAAARLPAVPGGEHVSAVHVGDGAQKSAISGNEVSRGTPFEVGSEPRGSSDGSFRPHFNAPSSQRKKLRTLPALHNFNLVHFKRPITTASEHNLFLELYMKHANKSGTNYRALLMEFNSAVARQIWGLSQGGHQQAIESDLYFKDFRDIIRYERQLVRSLLSREADNTSVALKSAIEHATSLPTDSTMTTSSSIFPPQTLGCGLGRGQSFAAASLVQQVDPPSLVPEPPTQVCTGPLIYRPAEVESFRQKAGNQGGKGVGKKCRKCDPDGKLGIMRGAEHDCPYSKKNTHKRKRE